MTINEMFQGVAPKERIKAIVKYHGNLIGHYFSLPDDFVWEDFSYFIDEEGRYGFGIWGGDKDYDVEKAGFETFRKAQNALIKTLQEVIK